MHGDRHLHRRLATAAVRPMNWAQCTLSAMHQEEERSAMHREEEELDRRVRQSSRPQTLDSKT